MDKSHYTMTEAARELGITKARMNVIVRRVEIPQQRSLMDKRLRIIEARDVERLRGLIQDKTGALVEGELDG